MADFDPSRWDAAMSNAGLGGFSTNGRSSYGIPLNPQSPIYLGKGERLTPKLGPGPYAPGHKPSPIPFTEQDKEMTYGEAQIVPRDWDQKTLQEFVNKGIMYKLPGFDINMGMPEILSAWDELVRASYALNQGDPKKKWTPWDVMNSYANNEGKFGTTRKGDWIYDVATGKPIKYVGPTSKTKTSKQVNLSSAEEVRALAMEALRQALGRNPTDQEVAQFRSSINSLETSRPEVTTTTVQLKPNLETGEVEEVSSASTTQGGVGQAEAEALIQGKVQGTPEYAKFQGANYFNDLLAMMGGGM